MKKVTFLLVGLFLLLTACSKQEETDMFAETAKTDCVWKTPNNKIIPCQFIDKWEKYEQEKATKWNFQTYSCTTPDGLPGIYCTATGSGCSSAFGCTHCLNC
ncbi:hypothetical protein C7N43_04440 [Sphingobacteriales bacterium UPWRP_1]|nr:hypothetical protein B6N25_04975 [Sphingobacteriales bacterium TSM_CSS]PSJ78313.1 hypothetical protein C7N43_04440 [Sphingobacteriales bacterium UPWRP_1]